MNDIVKQETVPSMLTIIERVASDPTADVAKLEKMLELQERIMAKNAEIAFNNAMADMQDELPMIEKTAKAHNSKYAKLEDIHEKISPILKKHGFSVSYDSDYTEKAVIIKGVLSHREGHSKTASLRLPIDNSGSKNDVQGMGSTLSYGRRYLLGLLLNLVTKDEDDDAQGGSVSIEQAAEIDKKLNEVGADKKAFLKYMGIDDVRNIPASKYELAMVSIAKAFAKKGEKK